MYRSAKFYAARTAAINEALEQSERERAVRALAKPQPVAPPPSAKALARCGDHVPVTLGVFFGDRQGTVVDAMICYEVALNFFIAKYIDDEGNTHILQCVDYNKTDDIYFYAISEEAVF